VRFPRHDRRDGAQEEGRAIIEFIFLGILMLLPLTYLVLTAARLQAAAFSASLAGREAGRAFVTGVNDDDAHKRAQAAAGLAFEDFAFRDGTDLKLACDGTPCLRAGGNVTATATIAVELPLIPDFIASRLPSSVSISSTHVATVDTYVSR
jgi:hypothetical protein